MCRFLGLVHVRTCSRFVCVCRFKILRVCVCVLVRVRDVVGVLVYLHAFCVCARACVPGVCACLF